MNLLSIPALLMTGAIAYVGVRHVVAYLRIPERREHLAFAATCFFSAFYTAATAALYSAETPAEGLMWQRVQVVMVIYVAIAFIWFVNRFTGLISPFVRNTFSIY